MFSKKCPNCGSTATLKIHVPHVNHHAGHAIIHHAGHIGKWLMRHPVTAVGGVILAGVAVVGNALVESEYQCKSCKTHFTI